jgi:hypothetical protein
LLFGEGICFDVVIAVICEGCFVVGLVWGGGGGGGMCCSHPFFPGVSEVGCS